MNQQSSSVSSTATLTQSKTDSPIIIVSAVRSGTTLLRLLLDHHPDINIFGEFEASVTILPSSGFTNLEYFINWIKQDRQTSQYHFNYPQNAANYIDFIHDLTHQAADRTSKPNFGFTIHSNFHRCPDLWPNARYIHIVRDPRDVANSCVRMGWAGNVFAAAHTWLSAQSKWNTLQKQLQYDQYIQLTYENLIAQPEETLTRICNFLNLSYNPSMLAFHEDTTYSPLDPSLANQWIKKLTPPQCHYVESQCAPLMQHYGYQLSSPNPQSLSPLKQTHLKLDHKIRRITFNIKRYSLPLYCAWKLTQRFPQTNRFKQYVHQRINQIDQQYIK